MKEKWIKVSIIIVVIIIIILGVMVINMIKNDVGYQDIRIDGDESEYIKQEGVTDVTNETFYYTVSDCVQKYYTYWTLDINREYPVLQDDEEVYTSYNYAQSQGITTDIAKKEAVYQMLNSAFINENSITTDNLDEYLEYTNRPLTFTTIKMTELDDERIKTFGVYGKVETANTSEFITYQYFIVTLDIYNMTFMIEPIKEKEIDINQVVLEKKVESIEKQEYNTFVYNRINETMLLTNYLAYYKKNAIKYPDEMYNSLDETYRESRFGSLEGFKQYVNENQDRIRKITLSKYQKTQEDGYTQYVCIDTDGNYYIFRETAIMQFTLLLDTYTIDIPEFTQKYDSADNETKMGMNIEKIVMALNAKDYGYIYGKLADGFKNNYFQSEEAFQQYAQNNFFEKNTVEYESVDNEGKNYMFDIQIQNTDNSAESISKRIIMQLGEGTEFVFSFNV